MGQSREPALWSVTHFPALTEREREREGEKRPVKREGEIKEREKDDERKKRNKRKGEKRARTFSSFRSLSTLFLFVHFPHFL